MKRAYLIIALLCFSLTQVHADEPKRKTKPASKQSSAYPSSITSLERDEIRAATTKTSPRLNCGDNLKCDRFNLNRLMNGGSEGNYRIFEGRNADGSHNPNGKAIVNMRTRSSVTKVENFFTHYRINEHCEIAEEHSDEFHIWFQRDQNGAMHIPRGAMPDEDCIPIDHQNARLKEVDGKYMVMSGSSRIYNFEYDGRAASDALCLIKTYKFTKACWAGGRQTLSYLRR